MDPKPWFKLHCLHVSQSIWKYKFAMLLSRYSDQSKSEQYNMKTKLSSWLFDQYSSSFPLSYQVLHLETMFPCLYYPWSRIWSLNRSRIWSLNRSRIWSLNRLRIWSSNRTKMGTLYIGPNFSTYIYVLNVDLHKGPYSAQGTP